MVFCKKLESQRRRKAFTIEEKGAIIRRLENGESNSSLAKEFGVGHSTISTIYKNKIQVVESLNSNVFKSKRLRKSRQENVDQALFQWYKITTDKGIPISGLMLQKTANAFAARFGTRDFNCSASWISRFKVRHNIVSGKIVGDTASVNSNLTTEWFSSVWPDLRRKFSDDEIFSANESGLFYKLMPHQTLKFKGISCNMGEMSSERFTIMAATNMSGTEKKKLLIIGKSQNMKCLSSAECLPVDYAHNSKAWMTSELFEKWLREWDSDLGKKKKKILLLVDQCHPHFKVSGLNSITLSFLPPHTTANLQPMDHGVIKSLKTNYRKNLVLKILNCLENNNECHSFTNITMLDAIVMINDAWKKLSQSTIQNSFKGAGFGGSMSVPLKHELEEDPFHLWVQNLNLDSLAPPGLWKDYVDIDNALLTCEELTDENHLITDQLEIDRDDDINEASPTVAEALKSAETLSRFVYGNIKNDDLTTAMSYLNNSVRDCYYATRKKKKQLFLKLI